MRVVCLVILLAFAGCGPVTDARPTSTDGCALSNGVVLSYGQQSDSVCGRDGAACGTCQLGEVCTSGTCVTSSSRRPAPPR
jgi:hypothetical protein